MPKSSTLISGLLFAITLGGTAFFSGFRPSFFLSTLGWVMLMLAMVSPFLFLLSLRADQVSWKVSLTIVGILTATLIIVCFIPAWYYFTYLPASAPMFIVQ